jgi:hypothetical protein
MYITTKFIDRGSERSEVTVTDRNFNITPTLQEYEFQTKRAVSITTEALRLIELSDRVSAVMKSSISDTLLLMVEQCDMARLGRVTSSKQQSGWEQG